MFVCVRASSSNQEHFATMDTLARLLKTSLGSLTFAGTKDKVAVTFQHVVAQNVAPTRLLQINDLCQGLQVGNCTYVPGPMVNQMPVEKSAAKLHLCTNSRCCFFVCVALGFHSWQSVCVLCLVSFFECVVHILSVCALGCL